ncbi:hypothetical protein HALLA_18305 [Halostagnicola larsenii XH-48]|uniref:Uncharacterized protein n=1 Tax=Halostagnicola larsenii XH-48 TaxID=797299 RepID=W0JV59_9EURY|nr:hypothetical protein HALLA_18305 [Halostagnicola larsenii XH-48]
MSGDTLGFVGSVRHRRLASNQQMEVGVSATVFQ